MSNATRRRASVFQVVSVDPDGTHHDWGLGATLRFTTSTRAWESVDLLNEMARKSGNPRRFHVEARKTEID